MSNWLIILFLALHALSAVFWVGTTFVFARGVAIGTPIQRAQLGAATFAILTGVILWGMNHSGAPGTIEIVLAIGAACALAAAIAQGWMRKTNPLLSQRLAAPLLGLALIAMVTARYWV
jgi:hypothetical protein